MVSQVVRRYENWIEGQKRRYGKADGRIDPAGNPDIDEKKANRSRGCAGDRTKQIQLSAKELTKPSFLAARNVVISPVNLRQPSAVKKHDVRICDTGLNGTSGTYRFFVLCSGAIRKGRQSSGHVWTGTDAIYPFSPLPFLHYPFLFYLSNPQRHNIGHTCTGTDALIEIRRRAVGIARSRSMAGACADAAKFR